ncbi:hypothetical protein HY224_00170 [Candidatus Uhrbacteria bacterium]|nr:hypothetical protein [Candidatus Uhrbacteria bacterium]
MEQVDPKVREYLILVLCNVLTTPLDAVSTGEDIVKELCKTKTWVGSSGGVFNLETMVVMVNRKTMEHITNLTYQELKLAIQLCGVIVEADSLKDPKMRMNKHAEINEQLEIWLLGFEPED